VEGKTLYLAVGAAGLFVIIIGTLLLYSGEPPPAPAPPRPPPPPEVTMNSVLKYSQPVYHALVETDARTFKVPIPTLDELGRPNPPNGSPIASVRLLDGRRRILLGDCNDANWNPVLHGAFLGWNWFTPHFSGIASRTHPGWILVSTYTDPLTECPNKSVGNQPFTREIFFLKTDGSGAVKRLTHHHSDQATNASGDKDYWAEPHATSSWDGTIVLYATVWQKPWAHYYLNTVTGNWWP